MQLIKGTTNFDFLGRTRRNLALAISVLTVVVSIASLATRGLELGIDFTGGILVEAGYPGPANLDQIRTGLADAGFREVRVQRFGPETDVQVRLPPQPDSEPNRIRDELRSILEAGDPGVELRGVAFVSAQVGDELTEQGGLAMIFTLVMIFIYVMFRFQWKFALGAVVATAHDVITTIGVFSIFRIPFDLSVVAAVLAVIGYSLNDTVVNFDRIRENFTRLRGVSPLESMNVSINEVLARTIITGLTTLIVLFALLMLGGESVGPFSIALIVGIVIGTYSSIYVASAIALLLDVTPQDLLPPETNPDLIDDLP